jgi:hypothetical protein
VAAGVSPGGCSLLNIYTAILIYGQVVVYSELDFVRRDRSGIRMLIVVAGILVISGMIFLQPISRTKDTPLMRRISSLHQIVSKLRWYADEHSIFPGGAPVNSNLDGLVAVGVLSREDAAYIRTNHIEYRGFDLGHVAADAVVFECVFSNTPSPCRVIAYSDGHVERRVFQKTQ